MEKLGGTIIGSCSQTPDKINSTWREEGGAGPFAGVVEDAVSLPFYHDEDCSLAKELGVAIEMDPAGNTAFAGGPAKSEARPT